MPGQNFDEYWRAYLAGHMQRSTRIFHYIGLFFAPLAGLAASLLLVWWAFFVVAPFFYVVAFLTHPYIEHNSNKPFADRPLWSAIAFLRMLMLDLTGQLSHELQRQGLHHS